jgi:hypothetical protein
MYESQISCKEPSMYVLGSIMYKTNLVNAVALMYTPHWLIQTFFAVAPSRNSMGLIRGGHLGHRRP